VTGLLLLVGVFLFAENSCAISHNAFGTL